MIKLFSVFFLLFMGPCAKVMAQKDSTLEVRLNATRTSERESILTITAIPAKGTKIFSIEKKVADAPATTIYFDSSTLKKLTGKISELGSATEEKDAVLEMDVKYFSDTVIWRQKIVNENADSSLVKADVTFFIKKEGEYLPVEEKLRVWVPAANKVLLNTSKPADLTTTEKNKTLWWIFISAFAGGLLALLTPCVYSMVPVTVSFFTKRSKTVKEGRKNAVWYAASIVIIFTLLGFFITLIFGPAALNNLATNWIANLLFFVVFLLFGISFLGAFDINLPSSWMNQSDSRAGAGSFAGIFFMALTLVLVSFSCTGPIIGNLLVLAAKGNFYGPLIGMFGFSLAMALPFALFAFFPSKLAVLSKAGGWQNAIKVTLGFLELALALKFLSNADLVKGWRLLDREIFLSLWIVIFLLLGLYLLGKLRFHHDGDLPKNDFGLPYLTITRLLFACMPLSFVVYMIPGLWGAPLNGISAFLPPMGTQDFVLGNTTANVPGNSASIGALPTPKKYYERMHIFEPEVVKKFGLVTYYDFNEAREISRMANRPLMLDFTGINCVNCRKMEAGVWSNPEVLRRLKENFVIASLYIDVHEISIPDKEQYTSASQGTLVETLGDLNADIQISQFGSNAQPFYFFLDNDGKRLRQEGYGYNPDVNKFIRLLDEVFTEYKKRQH